MSKRCAVSSGLDRKSMMARDLPPIAPGGARPLAQSDVSLAVAILPSPRANHVSATTPAKSAGTLQPVLH